MQAQHLRFARFAVAASLAAGLLLGAVGCADSASIADSYVQTLDHREIGVIVVKGEVFSQARILGMPAQMAIAGKYLWVSDRAEEPFVHALDTATGSVVASFGRRGQGPEDFGIILNVFTRPGTGDDLWVSDSQHGVRRMFQAGSLPSQLRNPRPVGPLGRRAGYIHPLGAARFLSHGIGDTATFVIFDDSGSVLRVAGVPLPGPDSVPRRERLRASNATVCPMQAGQGFAQVYHSFGHVVYFDSLGTRTKSARVPYGTAPRFGVSQSTRRLQFQPHRTYYLWCTFSDAHLFALFSGKLESDERTDRYGYAEGQYVHVFDMTGRLVRVLDLGVGVATIAVDERGGRLYGGSWTDATVHRFNLTL